MKLRYQQQRIVYSSHRVEGNDRPRFEAVYGPESDVYEAKPGTLEHWLTERYCLYAQLPDGALQTTDVHHTPWPLQRASAEIAVNEMLRPWQIELPEVAPLLHFARRLDVIVWPSRRCD
jgi:hypothetical protein